MEGQLQLRREDQEQERETKMQHLPLQSSPYLKCTDLEDKFIGYGSAIQGPLSPKGGGATTSTATADGSRFSLGQDDAIDRKLK